MERIVIIVHGKSKATDKKLINTQAKKVIEIPRRRVPLKISNKKYEPQTPNNNGHMRHTSACATGCISIYVVNGKNIKQSKKRKPNNK